MVDVDEAVCDIEEDTKTASIQSVFSRIFAYFAIQYFEHYRECVVFGICEEKPFHKIHRGGMLH